MIARSAPIRIADQPIASSCDAADPSACDDGEPCTADACIAGTGCVSTPVSDFASVTCTCERRLPATCVGVRIPAAVADRRKRVCRLFDAAATVGRRAALRRLRRAAKTVAASIRIVSKTPPRRLSSACAGAIKIELRDARERAAGLVKALTRR